MKVLTMVQGSPEWITARLGRVTASEIDALVSPEGKVRTGAGPQSYLYRKVAEKVLGFQLNDFQSHEMAQGSIVEHEAIPWFAFAHETPVERVGFCIDETRPIGFSPDGLIGADGGIEVKCPQPAQHLQYLMEGDVPVQYRAQVQFSMYVSGRKWWKFLSYSRQFPQLLVHVERDPAMHDSFDGALAKFLPRFDEAVAKATALRAESFPQNTGSRAA